MKNDKFQENHTRPGMIDARARYRAAARRLRNNALEYELLTAPIHRDKRIKYKIWKNV